MFGFISVAPRIHGEIYGLTASFPARFARIGAAAAACFVNARLVGRIAPARILARAPTAMAPLALRAAGARPRPRRSGGRRRR